MRQRHPELQVLYVSMNKFQAQFQTAYKNGEIPDFIHFYQMIDVLIIDDIQELTGKTGTQNAFFNIFNHLQLAGKQLILTSDKPPVELKDIEQRLLTRFKWGLSAQLNTPDYDTKLKIIRAKAQKLGAQITDDVVAYLADNISANVREIEGALSSLVANASFLGRRITTSLAKEILKVYVKLYQKEITIDHIIEVVCEYLNLDFARFNSTERTREIAQARQIAMYLAKQHTKAPLTTIGSAIGGRNHATVLHSCKAVTNLIETDKAFRRQVLSQTERPLQHKAMLYFAAARPKITRLRFDSIPADRVIVDPQTVGRDTIALWFNVPSSSLPDTIKGEITYFKHDTVNQLQEVTEPLKLAWRLIETKEQEREREKLERERRKAEAAGEEWEEPKKENPFAFKMPTSGEINPENHLTVDFDYPLVKLDSAELLLTRLLEDNSIEDIPVRMVRDTGMLRRWQVRAPWKLGGQYTLTIPEGAITDVAGLSNDSIIRKYTVLDPEKFATVLIHVRGRDDGTKYIVQLLDGSNALKQEKRDVTTGDIRFNYVPAGEIKFRVIEDRNGNGKWDSGNVVERLQPERAEIYANDQGEDTFATKTNWEIEFSMDMNRIFAPVTMQSLSRLLDERESQRLRREAEKRAKEGPKRDQDRNRQQNDNNSNFNAAGGMFNNFR